MAEKVLQTRIQLKYDTYAQWDKVKSTFTPKKGEVCIVEIPAETGVATNEPTVLFKVGDGLKTFENLPWLSALAADVYSWAKAADVEFKDQKINFKRSNGTIIKTLDLSDFVTGAELTTKLNDYALANSIGDGNFTVAGGEGLTGTGSMTANQSDDTSATISHAVPSGAAPGQKGTSTGRTYIRTVTTDKFGHVTGITTGTETVTDTNQKVKAGSVEFNNNDTVEIKAGTNVTVTPDKDKKTITIASSYTDTNDNQTVKVGNITFGINDAVDFVAGTHMGEIVAKTDNKTITINGKDWSKEISDAVAGLSGAMHFVGVSTTNPKGETGATVSGHTTWKAGDVVLYATKEYVLKVDGNTADNWIELGDESAYDVKGTAQNLINNLDVAIKGGNDKYIASIKQENGKIIATEGTMPTALKNPNALTFGTKSYDGSKAETISASDLGALTKITTTANGGLKVTGNNNIDIDTNVTFILNCGTSTTVI